MREKMKAKLEEIRAWIKKNKKKLIIAGVSISAVLAAIIACNNLDELESVFKSLQSIADQDSENVSMADKMETNISCQNDTAEDFENGTNKATRPRHDVSEHIRNLPEGWSASEKKKASAAERGIVLYPGQTLVDAYSTGG